MGKYSETKIRKVLNLPSDTNLKCKIVFKKGKDEIKFVKAPDKSYICEACNSSCSTLYTAKFKIHGCSGKHKINLASQCLITMFNEQIESIPKKNDGKTKPTWKTPCRLCDDYVLKNRKESSVYKINKSNKFPILIDTSLCHTCDRIDNPYYNNCVELDSSIIREIPEATIKKYIKYLKDFIFYKDDSFETCYNEWITSTYYNKDSFADSSKLWKVKCKIDSNTNSMWEVRNKKILCQFFIYITFHKYISKEKYISRIFFIPKYYAEYIFDNCSEELQEVIKTLRNF